MKNLILKAMPVFIIFTLILTLAACNSGNPADSDDSAGAADAADNAEQVADSEENANLFPIKTSIRYDCTLAPYLVADKLGYFKDEGLELTWTGELPSSEYITGVLSGEIDFADAHPNELAVQIYGGAKIHAVGRSIIEPDASVDPRLRHMRYYVTQEAYDAGVKTIADLSGYKSDETLKSAGWENTCETFILNAALDAKGVDRAKLEWIHFDGDVAKIQALKLKQIDIIGVHPPFFDAAVEAGLVLIGDSSDAGLGEATGVYLYYFSDKFIDEHTDEVAGFVRAMTKAQQWANANLEQTAVWTGEFIKQEVKGNHFYSETTEIDEATILPWIEDLENSGTIPAGAIKVTDIITHRFEAQ
jgi:ABC-type nitrate/sulfonate/bicarbonate transport system substrate-binding protein